VQVIRRRGILEVIDADTRKPASGVPDRNTIRPAANPCASKLRGRQVLIEIFRKSFVTVPRIAHCTLRVFHQGADELRSADLPQRRIDHGIVALTVNVDWSELALNGGHHPRRGFFLRSPDRRGVELSQNSVGKAAYFQWRNLEVRQVFRTDLEAVPRKKDEWAV